MKKVFLYILGAVALMGTVSCSSDSDEVQPQAFTRLTIDADKGNRYDVEDARTRSLNESNNVINFTWEISDKVYVYTRGWGSLLGQLSPVTGRTGSSQTKLDGKLSTTGVKLGDWLDFIMPRAEWDYTGQTGTVEKIATDYDYARAEASITFTDSDGKLHGSNATFKSEQAIVKFVLKDNVGNDLKVTSLTVSSGGNKLVLKSQQDGTALQYGDLTITPASETNVLYVAIRNDINGEDSYTLTVKTKSGVTYSYTKSDVMFAKGKFKTINVKMKGQDDTYTDRDGYISENVEDWN